MNLRKVFIAVVGPLFFSFFFFCSTYSHAEEPTPKNLEPESFANFRAPDTKLRTGPEAEAYCKGLSDKTRLPTASELQELFISKTTSPASYPDAGFIQNDEMCTLHGWPLNHQCGGSSGFYWARDVDESGKYNYYVVSMTVGLIQWPKPEYTALVACAVVSP